MERLSQVPEPDNQGRASPSRTALVTRAAMALLGGLLGYQGASWLLEAEALSGAINLFYLTVLGALVGYLASAPLVPRMERAWRQVRRRAGRIPPQTVLAATLGSTVALVITVLLNTLLSSVPGFTWYWSLLLTSVLVTGFSWFFVVNQQLFGLLRSGPAIAATPLSEGSLKLLDTSAIIDGRVADVVEANFLEGKLLIPNFVLQELQNIADSSDPLRRNRGRRGLSVLDRLVAQTKLEVQVIHEDVPGVQAVDEKLIRLCQKRQAALITTDYNLNRVAALQQVRILNINQLANSVRAMFLPGERLSLHIVKEGREPGQGLAYLDDGTMVVIEDAQGYVDATVDVTVTSNLQTNMGRMIFARLRRSDDA